MNKIFSIIIAGTIALGAASLIGCKGDKHQHTHDKNAKVLDLKTDQKKCPVMGGDINKHYYAVHKGKVVYFCCATCLKDFNKDPEKYMKKLKGIKLPDAPKDKMGDMHKDDMHKDDMHKGHMHK